MSKEIIKQDDCSEEIIETKEKLTGVINNELPVEAVNIIVDEIEAGWGDIAVTAAIRKRAAKKLGADIAVANNWKTISDILKHIDLVEISKNHGNEVGQINKCVAVIIGIIFPVTSIFMSAISSLSDKKAGKIIELVGRPTPSHLLNSICKKMAEKKYFSAAVECEMQLANINEALSALSARKAELEQNISDLSNDIDSETTTLNKLQRNFIAKLFNKKKIAEKAASLDALNVESSSLHEELSLVTADIAEALVQKENITKRMAFIHGENGDTIAKKIESNSHLLVD